MKQMYCRNAKMSKNAKKQKCKVLKIIHLKLEIAFKSFRK